MNQPIRFLMVLAIICVVSPDSKTLAQWIEQDFDLQDGWNSIYLEVDPRISDADAVFTTNPPNAISRVWGWRAGSTSNNCADPNDPECLPSNASPWRVWVPEGVPGHEVNSLTVVRGNSVYLVLANSASSLTIRGIPDPLPTVWQPGYNVAGFHVDGENPPSFHDHLSASDSFANTRVFRMLQDGALDEVNDLGLAIVPGQGYWVASEFVTSYDGPLSINLSSIQGLNFRDFLVEQRFELENLGDQVRTVDIQVIPSLNPPAGSSIFPENAGVVPLKTRNYGAADVLYDLQDLSPTNPLIEFLAAGPGHVDSSARSLIRVSVDRHGLQQAKVNLDGSGLQYQCVLKLTDGAGSRRWLPVTAEVPNQGGLYVGHVSVDAVAWVQADSRIVLDADASDGYETPAWDCNRNGIADSIDIAEGTSADADPPNGIPDECELGTNTMVPRPVQAPFIFPVLIHFDGVATYTFLNEVTLLYAPSPDGDDGHYVLATPDCTHCDQLRAGSVIDGEPFARRIATAAFTFDNDVLLSGGFSSTLQGQVVVDSDDRLHPFRHTFHPHHDGDQLGEIPTITRTFLFDFNCQPPPGVPVQPGAGDAVLTGCYFEILGGTTIGDPPDLESIPGLHKRDINVSGRFELRRISSINELNQTQQGGAL